MRRPILLMVVTALFIASLVALAPSAVAQAPKGNAGSTNADPIAQQNAPSQAQAAPPPPPAYDVCGNPIIPGDQTINQSSAAC